MEENKRRAEKELLDQGIVGMILPPQRNGGELLDDEMSDRVSHGEKLDMNCDFDSVFGDFKIREQERIIAQKKEAHDSA